MRKVYIKPCLIVESFQLNAAAASGCAVSVANNTRYKIVHSTEQCPLDIGGDVIIFATSECDYNPDGICYHAPENTRLAVYTES